MTGAGEQGDPSPPRSPSPDVLSELPEVRKREFPNLGPDVYLNAAGAGVFPGRTVETVTELARLRQRPGDLPDRLPGDYLRRARTAAAGLVGGDPAEITLSPNTTYGINLAAACVAAGDPGVIVVSEAEFPANVYPWLALEERGFEVEMIPLDARGWPDEETLLRRLRSDDVRALAVSAVHFHTGYRMALGRLGSACRAEGILFAVDAIQAAGVVPLDVTEMKIDVLATGGQKWLCSPFGSGFCWIRRELQPRFRPPMPSWLAFTGSRDFSVLTGYGPDYLDDGRKFEPATLGVQDYGGMAASIGLIGGIGVGTILDHVQRLHEPLIEWGRRRDDVELATPVDRARRGGILAFRGVDVEGLRGSLEEAGVHAVVREGLLRFAPHFYNTDGEIERVVEVLRGR